MKVFVVNDLSFIFVILSCHSQGTVRIRNKAVPCHREGQLRMALDFLTFASVVYSQWDPAAPH